ncbi:GL23291 [Drosophila persimilis]|uniref:GL23291 n=1 Tax=Drosophila persimilis TaxID=7234 RepID=B4G4V6_DROPE|nr:GL23291 [Drosophila persimilis]
MLFRKIICMLVILIAFCFSEGFIRRPRGKVHRKRQMAESYPDLVWLDEGGQKGVGSEACKGGGAPAKSDCGLGKGDPKSKASNIAQKAAQEAKAANEAQGSAAEAASLKIKSELADKAVQSARAAEAALAGKQQILEQLEVEQREAEAVVNEVTNSLQSTNANAAVANTAAVEAQKQVADLKTMLEAASANLNSIEAVSNGAQREMEEKLSCWRRPRTG